MAKLHELLAVESNLKGQSEKARTDLIETFQKKRHHFTQTRKTFTPLGENVVEKVEEQLDLQTTVKKELQWASEFIVKAIDAGHQVNQANTQAAADVILEDGTVVIENAPATTLLELEKRMAELHAFVSAIPTLDPAKGFRPDPDTGDGVYKAREVRKTRTKKENKVLTLHPGTDKHPPQVQLVQEDVPVGDIIEQEWSGMLTVAEKGDMLARVENLTRAIKRARSRANDQEVDTDKFRIGRKLVNYAFGLK